MVPAGIKESLKDALWRLVPHYLTKDGVTPSPAEMHEFIRLLEALDASPVKQPAQQGREESVDQTQDTNPSTALSTNPGTPKRKRGRVKGDGEYERKAPDVCNRLRSNEKPGKGIRRLIKEGRIELPGSADATEENRIERLCNN